MDRRPELRHLIGQARRAPGIAPARLPEAQLAANFADLHPALNGHEALVASDRCYFCHDAPCITACPTDIDIPMFIRQIQTGQPKAAAKTIFEQNILGGMCARVCPTETLCEEACVRMTAEGEPVAIGRLQRFATDTLMAENGHPFERAPDTGRTVAVVGAGPAGLACAHRLAMKGHKVRVFDTRPKPGGLKGMLREEALRAQMGVRLAAELLPAADGMALVLSLRRAAEALEGLRA